MIYLPAIRVDSQFEYRHYGSQSIRMQLQVAWELWVSLEWGNGHRRMTVMTAVRPVQREREIMADPTSSFWKRTWLDILHQSRTG
jgi:hypothetical protein